MILLALILIAVGVLCSRWMKVYVLFPATGFAWVVALYYGRLESFTIMQTLIAAVLLGAGLQFGYLLGAVFANQRRTHIRKRGVVALRR